MDQDGVCDELDNCPEDYNPNQEDFNADDIGDACDGVGVNENEVKKTIIQVVDFLGREMGAGTKNRMLLYIYDDGSVEKELILIKWKN